MPEMKYILSVMAAVLLFTLVAKRAVRAGCLFEKRSIQPWPGILSLHLTQLV
jgi:hypothetical protein